MLDDGGDDNENNNNNNRKDKYGKQVCPKDNDDLGIEYGKCYKFKREQPWKFIPTLASTAVTSIKAIIDSNAPLESRVLESIKSNMPF